MNIMLKQCMPKPTSLMRSFDFLGSYANAYMDLCFDGNDFSLTIKKTNLTSVGNYFFIRPASFFYREFRKK